MPDDAVPQEPRERAIAYLRGELPQAYHKEAQDFIESYLNFNLAETYFDDDKRRVVILYATDHHLKPDIPYDELIEKLTS